MIRRWLARLGITLVELDLSDDPRWRAQVVLLQNAEAKAAQAESMVDTAFRMLERAAVDAMRPQRRTVFKAGPDVVELRPLRRRRG